jgi:protoporphyrinogen oxidase
MRFFISDKIMDRRTFIRNTLAALAGLAFSPPANSGQVLRNISSSSATKRHAVIIGAGVSGLAAGRRLAESGWKVDVFEKSPTYGGLCSTLVIEGFTFDLGPHVFHNSIRGLAPFKHHDLVPATFSESFLLGGKVLNFPLELVTQGYLFDMFTTLARNTLGGTKGRSSNLEDIAAAGYGRRVNEEIFRPLIEKWCNHPMNQLDPRYFASRMHSKLEMDYVLDYLRRVYNDVEKEIGDRLWRSPSSDGSPSKEGTEGIPDAPGYSGSIGARIVPDRLALSIDGLEIHCDCPVTALNVEDRRIISLEAAGQQVEPDFVISTAPLDRLATMIRGESCLKAFADVTYLNIVLVLARIARPSLLKTEWTWIPDSGVPFYRMSEMKVLGKNHAPAESTGLCLEVSVKGNDPEFNRSEDYWKQLARTFLEKTFSIRGREIIGLSVEKRDYAYPDFDKSNTAIISRCLKKPYVTAEMQQDFGTGIDNLALAGRAGTFIYLLTPWAILSGIAAADQALKYAGDASRA